MQRLLITGGIIVALLLIVVANAFYIVRVDQQAIVLRFGEAQYVVNSDAAQAKAGLHFKWPVVDDVFKNPAAHLPQQCSFRRSRRLRGSRSA